MFARWLTSPIIGAGTDDDPFRPQVADRTGAPGDRLEFVIPTDRFGQPLYADALVAAQVRDGDLESLSTSISAPDDLDSPHPHMDTLATRIGVQPEKTPRGLVRALGSRAQPWFDEREHLGNGTVNEPGSFVTDTFTDTDTTLLEDHVGENGATWLIHPSSAATPNGRIFANRLYAEVADALYYASGTSVTPEYDVDATFFCVTNFGGASVTARMSTTANTFYMFRPQGSTWELQKRVTGAFTSLGTWVDTIVDGDTRTSQCQIRNGTKKLFVSGVEQISSSDNAITAAGRVGFRSGAIGTDDSRWHLDSVDATNLPTGLDPLRSVKSPLRVAKRR